MRVLSWATLWAVISFVVATRWATAAWLLLSFFGVMAQWEFYVAETKRLGRALPKWLGCGIGAALFVWSLVSLIVFPDLAKYWWMGAASFCCAGLLMLALGGDFFVIGLGILYVPLLLNFLCPLGFWPSNPGWGDLIYVLAVTKFTDVGAYVIGSTLGRTKLAPKLSPGKTWEGFLGGVTVGFSCNAALVAWWGAAWMPWSEAILCGLLLPVLGSAGDLAESSVKRHAGIKDSGRLVPGIGGALDLVDSLLFTVPVFYAVRCFWG